MQKNNPILINVPHSSIFIPNEEMMYFTCPDIQNELAVMTDHFCDDLFDVNAEMIRFPVSRLVCDPERFRNDADEMMAKVGMGAVYALCSDGKKLKDIDDEHREWILNNYYDSYHRLLEEKVGTRLVEFGKCLIIDGHSFYDKPLPYEPDQDSERPDICIGTDDYHTPGKLSDTVGWFFKRKGYSVGYNRPYAGSIVPLKYYQKDKRVSSVMIEINRRLYIDHDIKKTDGYMRIKTDISRLAEVLWRFLSCRHFYYVRTRSKEERSYLLEILDNKGFCIEKGAGCFTVHDILESCLPLTINVASKEYGIMGNITCAAAAASSKVLMECDEFLHHNVEKFMF